MSELNTLKQHQNLLQLTKMVILRSFDSISLRLVKFIKQIKVQDFSNSKELSPIFSFLLFVFFLILSPIGH